MQFTPEQIKEMRDFVAWQAEERELREKAASDDLRSKRLVDEKQSLIEIVAGCTRRLREIEQSEKAIPSEFIQKHSYDHVQGMLRDLRDGKRFSNEKEITASCKFEEMDTKSLKEFASKEGRRSRISNNKTVQKSFAEWKERQE